VNIRPPKPKLFGRTLGCWAPFGVRRLDAAFPLSKGRIISTRVALAISFMLSVDIQKVFNQPATRSAHILRGDSIEPPPGSARILRAPASPSPPPPESTRDRFGLNARFEAPSGITILFGSSGSGKTSTLKCIAGIFKPDSGRILVDGVCLFDSEAGVDLKIRNRKAGYVFQNLALFPHLSALDNVQFAMSNLPSGERKRRAQSLLEAFKITHTAARYPDRISGGEAQRVALARALAADPRFLLLDEPLSAIDEATKLEIIADLKSINTELRLPIVYVTHSRDEAITLGERVVVFEEGRVRAIGEPLEIFGAPVSSSVARLTGVENVFTAYVTAVDEPGGIIAVQVSDESGACIVDAPLADHRIGDRVTLAIRSGDILLATLEPKNTSARNVLRGRISAIEARKDLTLIKVASGVTWTASVTRQAVQELGLATGLEVWIAFKTHSCYLLDK
jgi:molybdenum ABC transporter ATP-binding protein